MVNMLEASRNAFAAQVGAIRARLLSGTAMRSDKTGLRVGKSDWRLWAFHHQDSAVFISKPSRAKPSRAKAVVEEFLADFRRRSARWSVFSTSLNAFRVYGRQRSSA